jgi:hypothetical protein
MGSLQRLPFSCEKLPQSVRSVVLDVEARDADWEYGDIVDSIEAILEEGSPRSPDLLVALAWYRFEFAECVMVDDILDAGRAALVLIDEATIDNKVVSRLRVNAQRVVRREEQELVRVAKLVSVPEERLTLRQTKDLAYWLSNQPEAERKARAARLWLILYERQPESETYHGTKFYNFARGAICLAMFGQYEMAEPMLRQASEWSDSIAAANYSNFLCYTYEQMLLQARDRGDAHEFRHIWNAAVDRLHGLGLRFPTVYPLQTEMLAVAIDMGMEDIIAYLVRLIEEVRAPATLDSRTRMLLKRREDRKPD